jgi:amidase
VDPVEFPFFALQGRRGLYNHLVAAEFKAQITEWLQTTGPTYPKSFDELVARVNDPATNYRSPEKAVALAYTQSIALGLDDPVYLATKNEGLASMRAAVDAVFAKHRLDAVVFPTSPRPPTRIDDRAPPQPPFPPPNLANHSGYPDLVVPAGMTPDGLPVSISFFGPAFSEARLLGYGYDFEQATRAIRLPKHTPKLP